MALPKDFDGFKSTLHQNEPPQGWPNPLKSLWFDARDDWEAAHDLVDGLETPMANWVHAYLHRKEGDEWNAEYWYRQAGRPFPEINSTLEFRGLVDYLLQG
ncbi:hypothetical protein L0P88_23840 [Muricauda sp. SCSIO 64092]|uniref:hypothetical protein n=1 Tax=Allomuricauda sp. SCSIO 64092 TaxID=2908842 RepID=UPI001FF40D35|nr:hypothetical protein [Muricauda sp. SCSIO 64092]UOY06936.1 hypothetical protein L0P88_23840 [Muricauda sp. SCSIO 64092]